MPLKLEPEILSQIETAAFEYADYRAVRKNSTNAMAFTAGARHQHAIAFNMGINKSREAIVNMMLRKYKDLPHDAWRDIVEEIDQLKR